SHNENIIRVIQAKKPVLSGIFSVVYVVYFMYSAVVSLLVFSLLLSNFINPGLPFFAFYLLTLCCCYYSAYRGIAAIGRASTIFFSLIVLSIIIICFSLMFRINILNYSHIFEERPERIFDNTIYLVAYASSIPAIFLFVHKVKGKIKKTVLLAIMVSNLTILALSIISFGVLGEYLHTTPYPFYTATQLIELGAFQRLDVIFLALWTVGMFVNVSLSLSALRECVQNSVHAEKAKILNPILAVIVGIFSLVSAASEPVRYVVMNSKIMLILFISAAFIFPMIVVLSMGKKKISSTAARTATLTLAVILCIPLLTGCQKTQIQERMIIKGVGIDKQDEEYAVTVQYVDNYSDGSEQQNKCIQVKGKSIGDAMGKIKNSSGSEPFLGQNSALIVGWETAKGDMEAILDYFIRYSDARPTVKLFISETTADDILTLEVSGSIIPIDHLMTISPSNSKNDNLFTILNYVNQSKNQTDTPVATVIRVDENTVKLSSVAAIGGEGKIYKLDEDEFITYKTLIGIDNGTVLSFEGVSGRV
ncbi:MAG: GerAB/ArcD/ProY family transporter, partial [Clostridia bacterium]|nr:GerAB/ArcD/ProY family transporter [Clostridia bacterium]